MIVCQDKCCGRLKKNKGVRVTYIRAIQDMYEGETTSVSVRTPGCVTNDFPIRIGLYQGSALSLHLFHLVLDMLTRDRHKNIPKCMMFADDIYLIEESKEAVNSKLEIWIRLWNEGFSFKQE